jgi:hypothetical protein
MELKMGDVWGIDREGSRKRKDSRVVCDTRLFFACLEKSR